MTGPQTIHPHASKHHDHGGLMSVARLFVYTVVLVATSMLLPATMHGQRPGGGGGGGGVSVTPDDATADSVQSSSSDTVSFTVKNTGSSTDYFWISCSGTSGVSCTGTSTSGVSLGANQQTTVHAYFTVSTPGTGNISLNAFSEQTMVDDDGDYDVPIYGLEAPEVSLTPYNSDNQDMSRCAASCFAATYAQSTVPYFSLDTPRNITLVYHGDRVDPKPFVHANVRQQNGSPSAFYLQVKKSNGQFVTFLNNSNKLWFDASTSWVRLGGQFDASANGMGSTGVYDITVIVGAYYSGGGTSEATNDTKLIVVEEADAPVARGWRIAGIQRLYVQSDSSILITEGDGSAVYFEKSGSTFLSPDGEFSRLYKDGTGWKRLYPDSTDVRFYSTRLMRTVYDPFNKMTVYTYSGDKLSSIIDPNSKYTYLKYNANGLDSIYTSVTPRRVTNITVQSNGRLTRITDPDGRYTDFDYDGSLRLDEITSRLGYTTTLYYDSNSGKLDSIAAPAVAIHGLGGTYSPVTRFAAWQQVSVPYGSTSSGSPFTAVATSLIKGSVTEPGGGVTSFTVNKWGQPLVSTDPLSRNTTYTYNSDGLPVTIIYPSGGYVSNTYNSDGLVTYTRQNADSPTYMRYTAWAMPDSIWGTGQTAQRIFVTNAKVDSVRLGASAGDPGSLTRYQYDSHGRVEYLRDAVGQLLRRSWYSGTNGNLSKDSLPGGRVTTYGYDVYGRQKWVDRPAMPKDSVQYDVLNRVTSSWSAGYRTRFGYDSTGTGGFFNTVTDAKNQHYVDFYNAVGWVTKRQDPQNRWDYYEYSLDGELEEWTNRRNQSTNYAYDVLHRSVKKWGSNTGTDTLHYSTNGRVVTAIGPVSSEVSYLNLRGQPDSVKAHINTWDYKRRYSYTSAGLLNKVWGFSMRGTDFREREYRYDEPSGILDSLRLGTGWTRFQHNANLLPYRTTLPGGDRISRSFYSLHGVTAITPSAAHKGTTGRELGYDELGRLATQINYGYTKMNTYAYDNLGRLVADSFQTIPEENWCDEDDDYGFDCEGLTTDSAHYFSFDAVGNRTDHSGSYATGNRVTAFDGCSYQTDYDGNVTLRDCTSQDIRFHWTSDNLLKALKVVGGDSVDYDYDASGRLARKRVNGSVQAYYIWDGSNLLGELSSSGYKVAEYSYYPGMDNLHALVIGTTPYFAHEDGLGNVIALANQSQTLKRTYVYDEWGDLVGGSDIGSFNDRDRARFKGALWLGDEADLYYMRARWYEPRTGRFLSEDPIGLAGGINPYVFAGDNPVGNRDPTGEYCYPVDDDTIRCENVTQGDLDAIKVFLDGDNSNGSGGYAGGGTGGGGTGSAAYAQFEAWGWTRDLPRSCCNFSSDFLRQGRGWLERALMERLEAGGWYGPPWSSPLRMTAPSSLRWKNKVGFPEHPGAAGYWHTHYLPGNPFPMLNDITYGPMAYRSTEVVFSWNLVFVINQYGHVTTCGY